MWCPSLAPGAKVTATWPITTDSFPGWYAKTRSNWAGTGKHLQAFAGNSNSALLKSFDETGRQTSTAITPTAAGEVPLWRYQRENVREMLKWHAGLRRTGHLISQSFVAELLMVSRMQALTKVLPVAEALIPSPSHADSCWAGTGLFLQLSVQRAH